MSIKRVQGLFFLTLMGFCQAALANLKTNVERLQAEFCSCQVTKQSLTPAGPGQQADESHKAAMQRRPAALCCPCHDQRLGVHQITEGLRI